MGLGSDLLKLQELDLECARAEKSLNELPILAELAKKRATYVRLKSEATKLLARRKDAQIAVDDLNEAERAAHDEIAAAQAAEIDSSDYRQVQDLEVKLSLLAKRLDKIAYDRPAAEDALKAAQDKEGQLLDYIKRFEASVVADTKSAREQATELKAKIAGIEQERDRVARRLPEDALERYGKASQRFKGIAVERLEGHVPSVCRTALQPASMDQLRRAIDIAECPYCHRILVVNERD